MNNEKILERFNKELAGRVEAEKRRALVTVLSGLSQPTLGHLLTCMFDSDWGSIELGEDDPLTVGDLVGDRQWDERVVDMLDRLMIGREVNPDHPWLDRPLTDLSERSDMPSDSWVQDVGGGAVRVDLSKLLRAQVEAMKAEGR